MYATGICYLNEQENLWESSFFKISSHIWLADSDELSLTLSLSSSSS